MLLYLCELAKRQAKKYAKERKRRTRRREF